MSIRCRHSLAGAIKAQRRGSFWGNSNASMPLRPALVPHQVGQVAYVDGHMIAYWSRVPMHKGKITMLGRIMAGSQAVIAHDDTGQGLFVEYHPPDRHV